MISIISARHRDRTARAGSRCALACAVGLLLFLVAMPGSTLGQKGSDDSTPAPRVIPDSLRFAHGLFRQRKFDLAAEEYQRFLETDPAVVDADDARFGLASARLLQGRYKEARSAFQEFLRLAPKHARARTAWYRLGELSYMLGDLPSAREALERFTADPAPHPNLETAWTYLGDVRSSLDDPKAAREAYEKSLAMAPDARLADRARYGLGRSLASLGETQPAIDVLREVVRRGASDWVDKSLLQIGKIEVNAARFADAEKTFDKLAGLVPPSSFQSEAQLRRGEALLRLDRHDEALRLLQPLAADPSQALAADASLALASIELRQGHADEALKTLDATLARAAKSPLEPALLYRSAEALRALKRPDEAKARFLKVAEVAPADPWADDAWLEAARLALDAGDHAEAGKLAAAFPEKFPKSKLGPDVVLIQARAAMSGRQPEAAVGLLEPLVGPEAKPSAVLAPDLAAAIRYELALAYRATGQGARADAILASLTTSAEAGFLLGQSHLEAGRYAEALAEFERYLNSSPKGQVADHALAHQTAAYLGLGKRDDAAKSLGVLAERFPESPALPPARLRLAESAFAAGDLPKAIEQFQILVGPNPAAKVEVPQAVRERAELGLARALSKKGDAGAAAAIFDTIIARTKDGPQAAGLTLERARSLEAAGKIDEAIAAYEQLETRFAADDSVLHAGLARARLLAESKRPEAAAELIGKLVADEAARKRLTTIGQPIDALLAERAWALADAGKTAEADDAFGELLKTFPNSEYAADARFNLAESANQKKDFAEVARLLVPLVKPDKPDAPKTPDRLLPAVLYRLGRTQIELSDWPAASSTLDRLIAEFANDRHLREARLLRAEAALRQDRFDAAESDLSALTAGPPSPDDPPNFASVVRERRLQSLLGLKRWKDALAEADALKAEKTDSARDVVEFARGRALLGLARPDDARAAFQAVIESHPGSELAAQAQLMRGETYFHEDRLREAKLEYLRVDSLFNAPRWQAAALLEAGKVDERLSQWSDAVETYNYLLNRFPDDPSTVEAKNEARKRRAAVLDQHKVKEPSDGEAK
ncbi:tetratricopeptide repeat protein [Paludisphaera borealis]|uniref:Outer membrane protein assembly factor BamD n=1 Tax=Paludisphaera borealis TaxID=1387353 RepID=A0A1U7CXL3_9BACT|nr:tetratricopeptide repeat protein [Paludisphaera borealis]APW63623.1 Outer membrane protein assembly factor BamD [Paludisphaera borealis]